MNTSLNNLRRSAMAKLDGVHFWVVHPMPMATTYLSWWQESVPSSWQLYPCSPPWQRWMTPT